MISYIPFLMSYNLNALLKHRDQPEHKQAVKNAVLNNLRS